MMAEQEMSSDTDTFKADVTGEKWAKEKAIEHYTPMIDGLAVDEDMERHLFEAAGRTVKLPDGAGIRKIRAGRKANRPPRPALSYTIFEL